MATTIDASKSITQSAARAYLAGDRRKAFDLFRCDPAQAQFRTFEGFDAGFARRLVSADPRVFAEAVLKRRYDEIARSCEWMTGDDEAQLIARALERLERAEQADIVGLEYALLRLQPHTLSALEVATAVIKAIGT